MLINNLSKYGIPQKDLDQMKAIEKYFPNCYKYGMRFVVSTLEKQSSSSYSKMEFCDNMLSFLTILKIISSTKQFSLLEALADFNSHVKPENCCLTGKYIKFTNGLIYDCDFDYYEFFSVVKNSVFLFEDFAVDLECSNIIRYGNLRSNISHFLNHILKQKDKDEDMTSFEYAELCFIKGLCHQIKSDKKLERDIDNVLNTIIQ